MASSLRFRSIRERPSVGGNLRGAPIFANDDRRSLDTSSTSHNDSQPHSNLQHSNNNIGSNVAFASIIVIMLFMFTICIVYAVIYNHQSQHKLKKSAENKVYNEISNTCETKVTAPATFDKNMYGSISFVGLVLFIFVVLMTAALMSGFDLPASLSFPISATIMFMIGIVLVGVAIVANSTHYPIQVCPRTADKYNSRTYKIAYNSQYVVLCLCVVGLIVGIAWIKLK